jgi:hypothetical protein
MFLLPQVAYKLLHLVLNERNKKLVLVLMEEVALVRYPKSKNDSFHCNEFLSDDEEKF